MTQKAGNVDRVNVNTFDVTNFFGTRARTVRRGKHDRYVNAWVSLDTETCADKRAGFIVMWTSTIIYGSQRVTVWGRTADSACDYLQALSTGLCLSERRRLVLYVHNYSYDYVFLRNFLFERFGEPTAALAVKTHRYITMTFGCGIELRDSYILAQCSLEKWAKDLGAQVQKATGQWDYKKHRTPASELTPDEIDYACADAEALAECVRLKAAQGGYTIGNIPLTATGYARDAARSAAFATDWHERVHKLDMTYQQYDRCSRTFQGGITHGNRWQIGRILHGVVSFDFASSYPFVMCTEIYPMSKWGLAMYSLEQIQRDSDRYAFMFDLILIDAKIKPGHAMPPIAQSKCLRFSNDAVWDNGKLISAAIVAIPCNEIDMQIYLDHYDATAVYHGLYENGKMQRGMVYTCVKKPLPQWFVDTIVQYFISKTTKKDADPQLYQYHKALLNAQYGMCGQRPVRADIVEDYQAAAGEEWRIVAPADPAQMLEDYYNKYNYFLPYQWGMYVTSYARRNLYRLGECCSQWIYCDTDSVKGIGWDLDKVNEYNRQCVEKLAARGIQPVTYKGRQYSMGVAEHDATYSEFITLGAKRYAYRDADDGELHITVAGVPKRGVKALHNDIRNFARGKVFHDTGKLVPEYHTQNGIRTVTRQGCRIRVGSWIRLVEADYKLDMTDRFDELLDAVIQMDRAED